MHSLLAAGMLLGSVVVTISATPTAPFAADIPYSTPSVFFAADSEAGNQTLQARDLRSPIPNRALNVEHMFQPLLDFDKDGCYYTASIDASGNRNPGLGPANGVPPNCLRATCRDPNRLQNSNVYSRARCNNGWCGILYGYYFEKDQVICGSWGAGHRHDWEHIVVFVKDNKVRRVAPSCHKGFYDPTNSPRLQGNRPKVVYHKDSGQTHCFRMGREKDEAIENYTGQWYNGELIGYYSWPSVGLRNQAVQPYNANDGPRLKVEDPWFRDTLRAAMGGQIPDFNPDIDG